MAASDGTLLNLAATLAETAAELQKLHGQRAPRASDPVLVAALVDVKAAVSHLSAAVHTLSAEVAEDAPPS